MRLTEHLEGLGRKVEPGDIEADDMLHVLQPDGSADPARDPKVDAKELRSLYRLMLLNRALDDRMVTLQRQGRIGFYIGSTGEEASILGSAYVLRPSDWVFPAYREHGASLMRGLPLSRLLAGFFGSEEDPAKGRQMPCHEAWKPGNLASISSPLATQIPHAVGVGWAARLKKKDDVALVYFGDGATSAPDFHAGLNFAGVFKAQTIFLCRNNQWAISVPISRQTASESIAIKARAYGLSGVRVDGNDLLAVIAATRQAHVRARAGQGATLIEAVTYRLKGHSTSDDPNIYRRPEQVEPWLKLDPLPRLRAHLVWLGALAPGEDEALRKEVDEEIREAAAKAEKARAPAPQSMFEDVFGHVPWHLAEERDALTGALQERNGEAM